MLNNYKKRDQDQKDKQEALFESSVRSISSISISLAGNGSPGSSRSAGAVFTVSENSDLSRPVYTLDEQGKWFQRQEAYLRALEHKEQTSKQLVNIVFAGLFVLAVHPVTICWFEGIARMVFSWTFVLLDMPRQSYSGNHAIEQFVLFYAKKLHESNDQVTATDLNLACKRMRDHLKQNDCPYFNTLTYWRTKGRDGGSVGRHLGRFLRDANQQTLWGRLPDKVRTLQTELLKEINRLYWTQCGYVPDAVHNWGNHAFWYARFLPLVLAWSVLSFSLYTCGVVMVGVAMGFYSVQALLQLVMHPVAQNETVCDKLERVHRFLSTWTINAGYFAWVFMPTACTWFSVLSYYVFPIALFQLHIVKGCFEIAAWARMNQTLSQEACHAMSFGERWGGLIGALCNIFMGMVLFAILLVAPGAMWASVPATGVLLAVAAVGSAFIAWRAQRAAHDYAERAISRHEDEQQAAEGQEVNRVRACV